MVAVRLAPVLASSLIRQEDCAVAAREVRPTSASAGRAAGEIALDKGRGGHTGVMVANHMCDEGRRQVEEKEGRRAVCVAVVGREHLYGGRWAVPERINVLVGGSRVWFPQRWFPHQQGGSAAAFCLWPSPRSQSTSCRRRPFDASRANFSGSAGCHTSFSTAAHRRHAGGWGDCLGGGAGSMRARAGGSFTASSLGG